MKFEGVVGTSDLPDIFQLLVSSGRVGALVVNQGRVQKRVFFTPEGVTLPFDTEQSNRLLGQILLARGLITEPQLVAALERQRASKMPIGEILVNLGATKAEAVQEALAYQLREDLFDLLTWEKAAFEFEEGAAPPKGGRAFLRTPTFNPDEIVMEAARRADEWKRIRAAIPSGRAVPLRVEGAPAPSDESSTVREVLSLSDGTCSIDEMRQILGRSEFDTLEATFAALATGAVRLADGRELSALAGEALKTRDAERARQILAHAADLAGVDLELRYDLGILCLWAGAERAAIDHLDLVLGRLVEEELPVKVTELLNSVAEQFPDIPWSYERRMKLLNPEQDFERAMQLARRLLELYDRRHDVETATKMFRWVRRFTTHEPEQAMRLAELLESRGDVAAAAQHYYLAARQLRFASDAGEAIRLCEKAVKLNARLMDARAYLKELLSQPRRRSRRRATQVATIAGLVVVGLLVLTQVAREWTASRALVRADDEAAQSLARGDFNTAGAVYEELAKDFGATTLGPVIVERRAGVETERTAFLSSRTFMTSALKRDAEASAAAGDFTAAVAAYGRLAALGSPEDAAFARGASKKLQAEREAFDARLREARDHEAAGRAAQAIASYRAALQSFEALFRHDNVTLPLLVESRPAGAEVFLDGRLAGRAPLVVRRPGAADSEIRLHLESYNDATLAVQAASSETVVRAMLVPSRRILAAHALHDIPVGPPAVLGDSVAFVTRGGRFVVWDTDDGRVLVDRSVNEGSSAFFAPVAAGDRWIVASIDGALFAFDDTGKELYRTPASGVLTADPKLVEGRIVLVHIGGKATWHDPATGSVEREARLTATPLGEIHPLASGRFVFPADGTSVQAFDPKQDRMAWTFEGHATVTRGLCVGGGTVLALLDGQTVVALDSVDGHERWRRNKGEERFETPASNASAAFVPSRDGWLTALDLRTGREIWRVKPDGAPSGVAADAQNVYVATAPGWLIALRVADGTVAWKTGLLAPPVGPPLRIADRVVVATSTGLVVSFGK